MQGGTNECGNECGRHGTCEGLGNCTDCPFGALDRQLLLTPRAWGPTSTPFLDGGPGRGPTSLLPPLPPPSTSRKHKKQLLFTPHLSSKLFNFIPRTNKSIFIAAGGAGSGLRFYLFIFQSPVKSAPIVWAGPEAHALTRFPPPPGREWLAGPSPHQGALKEGGGSFPPASCAVAI